MEKEEQSYIREWADNKREELKYSNDITLENLFAALMYGLVSFGRKNPNRKVSSDMKSLGMDITDHYSSDATLFEVGCYMYFRIDLWLFKNKPDFRDAISSAFMQEFNQIFARALGMSNISDIFNQRIEKYGELIRQRADIEKYYFYLSQLILRTKDNVLPTIYNFDKEPVTITGVFEDMGIKIALGSWEKAMIPALINSLKNFCDLMEKKK